MERCGSVCAIRCLAVIGGHLALGFLMLPLKPRSLHCLSLPYELTMVQAIFAEN